VENQQSSIDLPTKSKRHVGRGVVLAAAAIVCASAGVGGEYAYERYVQNPAPQLYFSPNGGCTTAITEAIDWAKSDIHVQAYAFDSNAIAEALVRAHKRHVNVSVLMDKSCRKIPGSMASYLSEAGIIVGVDEEHDIAHNKVIIVDGAKVVTGSFNFTYSAEERNAENVVVFTDKAIAMQYLKNWEAHWKHSTPLETLEVNFEPITPETSAIHVGQKCSATMTVASISSSQDLVFLNSRKDYDESGDLTLVIYPSAKPAKFGTNEDFGRYLRSIQGKVIRAAGEVSPYQRHYQIKVNRPNQLLSMP
jgi:PLD-like domain